MKNLRLYTGCYEKCKSGNLVSISGNKGKSVGFRGNSYTKLAPKKTFWNIWHNNIGKVTEEENNIYYMHQFYQQVLSKLDANEVIKELQAFGEDVVLLCFESENEFCHRHLVATWLEKNLKIQVNEVAITEDGEIEFLERNHEYVEMFENILDEYIEEWKE